MRLVKENNKFHTEIDYRDLVFILSLLIILGTIIDAKR